MLLVLNNPWVDDSVMTNLQERVPTEADEGLAVARVSDARSAPAAGERTALGGSVTIGRVLGELDELRVDGDWGVPRREALNALVALLCEAAPACVALVPAPCESVALHLRVLGHLSRHSAVRLAPDRATRAAELTGAVCARG